MSGEMTEEDGFRFASQLLDHPDPPTAILCSSTLMGMGAVRAIEQRGLRAGQDVSLITHDERLIGRPSPVWTSVVEKRDPKPVEVAESRRSSVAILYNKKENELGRVNGGVIIGACVSSALVKPDIDRQVESCQ